MVEFQMRWLIGSCLIWMYTVCSLVFEFSIWCSLDQRYLEISQLLILLSTFLALKVFLVFKSLFSVTSLMQCLKVCFKMQTEKVGMFLNKNRQTKSNTHVIWETVNINASYCQSVRNISRSKMFCQAILWWSRLFK